MSSSSTKKATQLGIPFGTACARLRKAVMFSLLQRLGEDICFQCGMKIESVDELSIEHIKPWLDEDTSLFWDLDNIAFSHLKCNRDAARTADSSIENLHQYNNSRAKPIVEGKAWCTRCKSYKPTSEFSEKSSSWTGFHHECKKCRSETRKKSE